MNNKEIQYIALIKLENILKIHNQIFTHGKLLSDEHASFVLENGNLSNDALFKLKTLEKEIPHTNIIALHEEKDQEILRISAPKRKDSLGIILDTTHQIIAKKESIEKTKKFYNHGGIDFLLSPFTILRKKAIQKGEANTLFILILNNTLYTLFFDEQKKIALHSFDRLTPYNEIQKSHFYEDAISEQVLYDEIHQLELSTLIGSLLQGYYDKSNNPKFCDKVVLYYTLKQLDDKQLEALKESLLLDIEYEPCLLEEEMLTLIKEKTIDQISFTPQRKKKNIFALLVWIFLAIATTAGAWYSFSVIQTTSDGVTPHQVIDTNQTTKVVEQPSLPNHIATNRAIIEFITHLFESIDDQSVLKEIQVSAMESTIIYSFLATNPFEKSLKPKMLALYAESETILTTQHKGFFTSIVSNTQIQKPLPRSFKKYIPSGERFLSSSEAKLGIEQLFKNDATLVTLESEKTEKYTEYIYQVKTLLPTPLDFFNTIKLLETQKYSIVLDYPIEFSKTNEGLEIHFRMIISQNKPQ